MNNIASKFVTIQGSKMHYLEAGSGDPILFLHGIPTSSYLWRKIIPHLATLGRCIALDLIGFGQSDKPDINYSVFDHIHYLEKFIETLKLRDITLIMHGWGSVIGFDYAMKNERNCKGLVFYEAFLRSLEVDNELALPFQEQIATLQEEQNELTLNGISFVDRMIAPNMMATLSNDDLDHYRQPFKEKGTTKPILQYIKELPGSNNSKVDKLIAEYTKKLTQSQLPKLLLYSVPGFIMTINTVMWAKNNLPNIEIIDVGEELHFAQESNPDLLGESISVWLQGIEQLHV